MTWVDSSAIKKHIMEYNEMVTNIYLSLNVLPPGSHFKHKIIFVFYDPTERRFQYGLMVYDKLCTL